MFKSRKAEIPAKDCITDGQFPIGDIGQVTNLVSKESLDLVDAARAKAGARLFLELSKFWESVGNDVSKLRHRNHSDLIPAFERYAELQFDAYARALLPDFQSEEDYVLRLAIHVTDELSNQIRPQKGLIMPHPVDKRDWGRLLALTRHRNPKIKQNAINTLHTVTSDPNGDWESFVGISLERHWLKDGFKDLNGRGLCTAKGFPLLNLTVQLQFRFALRLFINWFEFDRRLRAHLLLHLASWGAKTSHHIVGVADFGFDRPEVGQVLSDQVSDETAILASTARLPSTRPDPENAYLKRGGRPVAEQTGQLHQEWIAKGRPKLTGKVCDQIAGSLLPDEFGATNPGTKKRKNLRDRIRNAIRRAEKRSATKPFRSDI